MVNRTVLADQVCTGISRLHLARLIEELAGPWQAAVEGRRHQTRGGPGNELRLDATEVQVRRPAAGRGGRRAFVSGKMKQNTMKATVSADHQGRTLWTDALRPGRMHDATAARNEGIAVCFQHFPEVEVLVDDGCLGLRRDHPGQAITPPRKPNKIALPHVHAAREEARHPHSSKRITVEHALADHKRWKQLARWTHRRETPPATCRAIAGLVSDGTVNT
ncbi:transposase family protein [Streptomyces sp. NPDC047974]|uniref:transposase family protein n=1 Tax=Streptomyces sp. NPDC047974 TaxID=3154343 RepID=UPI0033E464DF